MRLKASATAASAMLPPETKFIFNCRSGLGFLREDSDPHTRHIGAFRATLPNAAERYLMSHCNPAGEPIPLKANLY